MNGIPFMVTQAMKAALRARGLTEEEIAQLKPEEAHKILNGGGAPPEPNRAICIAASFASVPVQVNTTRSIPSAWTPSRRSA